MSKSRYDLTYQDRDGIIHDIEVFAEIDDDLIYPSHVDWSLTGWTMRELKENGNRLMLYEDTKMGGLGIFALSLDQVVHCVLVFEESDGW